MGVEAGRRRWPAAVVAVAAADWLLAVGLVATDTRRDVMLPLLLVAASVLLAVQAARLRPVVAAVRASGREGRSPWRAAEATLGRAWSPRPARFALRELRLVWSLVLLARRRRDLDGATGPLVFTSHRDVLPTWLLLVGVTAVEVLVTPLLPLPVVVEQVLLVLGVWGLLLVAAVVAAVVVHPHLATEDHVVVRFGFWDEVRVPRAAVRAVLLRTATAARHGLLVDDGTATLAPSGSTNVVLVLEPPLTVRGQLVTELRLWADDARGLTQALSMPIRDV